MPEYGIKVMPDDLKEKLEGFIPSRSKYIFHLYGKQNTQKSQTVREILRDLFRDQYNAKVIWIVTGYDQTNMVIEHLENILIKFPPRDSILNLQSHSNLRNIHILTQGLIKPDKTMDQKKPYVLVIDNAENILSLHLSLERKNWRKELVEQWRIFLRSLIELNGEGFCLKVVLITNVHILDLEELDNFLQYCEKTGAGDDEYKTPETDKLIKNLQEVLQISEEDCDDKIVKPVFEIINKFLENGESLKKSESKFLGILLKNVSVGSREYINIGDIIYQYRDGIKLIEAINEIEMILPIKPAEKYIIDYIKQQVKKILGYAEKIRLKPTLAPNVHIWNVKIIKRVYAVYHLVDLFKKNSANSETDKQLIIFLNQAMKVLLHLPVRKEFSDVGDILRTYGYSNLLLEMIESIEENLFVSGNGDCKSDNGGKDDDYLEGFDEIFLTLFKCRNCIQSRINILKGNIGFYNYPEDYVLAVDNYCKVFELEEGNLKDPIEKYRFLATYEIINVLFQLIERKWKIFLSLKQKEGIEKCMMRLKGIFKKTIKELFDEQPWEQYDLFKITGELIKWLEKQEIVINKLKNNEISDKGSERNDSASLSGVDRKIAEIFDRLEKGYYAETEEAFFERTITARIKYHKLETKLSISDFAKNNQLGCLNLQAGKINYYIGRLDEMLSKISKCEPFWKFPIVYQLTKWLYFLGNAAASADNFSSESGSMNKIDVEKLIDINNKNSKESCPFSSGESLWREAKIKELTGDITQLQVKQTQNDRERQGYFKKRINLYNEVRKIYLTLNCGYQLEGILEKIEQTEVLLRGHFSLGDEYERIKK